MSNKDANKEAKPRPRSRRPAPRTTPSGTSRSSSAADLAENSRRARLHGDQAVGLRAVGEHPARARRHVQGDRPRERVLPAVHPAVASSRRRPRTSRASRRSARWSRTTASSRATASSCPTGRARGAAGRAADVGDDHRRDVREVGAELSRPAAAHQSVGERRALGDAHAPVPAHHRVPLAGGPHRARDRRGGRRGDDEDARRLRRVRRAVDGDAGDPGREDRGRALPRRGAARTASRR